MCVDTLVQHLSTAYATDAFGRNSRVGSTGQARCTPREKARSFHCSTCRRPELRTGSPIAVSLVRAREAETLPIRQGTRTGEEPGHRPSPTRKARLAAHLRIVHGARLDASPCSQVLRGSLLTVGQERVVTRGVPAHEHLLLLRSSVRVGTSEVRRGLRRRQGNCTHKQKQRRQQREAGKSMRRQLTVGDRAHKRRTHRSRQHVSE